MHPVLGSSKWVTTDEESTNFGVSISGNVSAVGGAAFVSSVNPNSGSLLQAVTLPIKNIGSIKPVVKSPDSSSYQDSTNITTTPAAKQPVSIFLIGGIALFALFILPKLLKHKR